ncbi:vomeronasal type-2 receptor 116-like [Anolis sagrei]|uniref:vomeronasal type-2 receptor 116-like n=1 Tax=Anolis sagrei TaxID=38937 RepID=UPI003521274B
MAPILALYKIPQLHHFLRYVSFNNSAGDKISFDQNGTLVTEFDIINWITFPNKSFVRIRVGTINPHAPHGNVFTISEDDIIWPTYFNQVPPLSICNDNCHVGYHKRKKEGEPFCCYDCIPCPAGMISNETDMDTCFECPEGQYPSNDQHECIPKYIIFLSYNGPLGVSLTIISLTFIFITALVLGIFFKYRDTAIVKANNRSLSYVLLISLLLSFSCAFLFIGQPNHLICLLRDIAFNVIFSVALSCVLAKTITVILVFKATTSGSKTKKWVGKPLVNSIVFSCPLIKTIICIVCLIISPPFLDFDMQLVVFMTLVLVLLPVGICKILPVPKCAVSKHLPILYEYYHAGDLIIPGVLSQLHITYEERDFRKEPNQLSIEEVS